MLIDRIYSSADASRFLRLASWRLEPALDAFYNDPGAVRAAAAHSDQHSSGSLVKNLDKMWERYRGECFAELEYGSLKRCPCLSDPQHPDETGIDGTILYCEDLAVEPEDVVMLAVAWLTKAPTMGRFVKSGWVDGWRRVKYVTVK